MTDMSASSSKETLQKRFFHYKKLDVKLYRADCRDLMESFIEETPEGRFDMIFADPPYFLSNGGISCHAGRRTKVDKGTWDQSQGAEQDHRFSRHWISLCQKLLKPNGTLWISGTHHIIHSIGYATQQLGMKILNQITWEKPNPPPNLSCRYFTHSTETLLWAGKNKKAKHTFNYKIMKELNGNKQMKSVWAIKPPQKQEKQLGKHPTQKPLELLERIILASTQVKDLIFDPFSGSGTVAVAAVKMGRACVACEIDPNYIDLSRKRLDLSRKRLKATKQGSP